jgi:hypothetical protein
VSELKKIFLFKFDLDFEINFFYRSNVLVESGINKHWSNLDKDTLPLIIRTFDFELKPKSYVQVLSLEDIKWSFFLLIIGCKLSLVSIIIERLHKKFHLKINLILLYRLLQRFICFTYNSLKYYFNLIVTKIKL